MEQSSLFKMLGVECVILVHTVSMYYFCNKCFSSKYFDYHVQRPHFNNSRNLWQLLMCISLAVIAKSMDGYNLGEYKLQRYLFNFNVY